MMNFNNNSRRELLKRIQEADFFALDLQLYLNTHPECERALKLYTEAIKEAKALRNEYEENYGPLTAARAAGRSPWQWSKSPWTWEKERS